jgi:hypothetical protein
MRQRWVLIAILAAAVVAVTTLTRFPAVQRSGFEWTPGILTVIVLVLAANGRPLAWGIAMGIGGLMTAFEAVLAIRDLQDPVPLALTSVGVIACLALWGLKPEEPSETSAPRNQG